MTVLRTTTHTQKNTTSRITTSRAGAASAESDFWGLSESGAAVAWDLCRFPRQANVAAFPSIRLYKRDGSGAERLARAINVNAPSYA
jgi:hypothetical protein